MLPRPDNIVSAGSHTVEQRAYGSCVHVQLFIDDGACHSDQYHRCMHLANTAMWKQQKLLPQDQMLTADLPCRLPLVVIFNSKQEVPADRCTTSTSSADADPAFLRHSHLLWVVAILQGRAC